RRGAGQRRDFLARKKRAVVFVETLTDIHQADLVAYAVLACEVKFLVKRRLFQIRQQTDSPGMAPRPAGLWRGPAAGRIASIVRLVVLHRQAELLDVVAALRTAGRLAR